MEIENNKISNISYNGSFKPTTMYNVVQKEYGEFLKGIEKSEFKNAPTRYLSELSLLKRLEASAKEFATEAEVKDVAAKIEGVKQILKDNFGIIHK